MIRRFPPHAELHARSSFLDAAYATGLFANNYHRGSDRHTRKRVFAPWGRPHSLEAVVVA